MLPMPTIHKLCGDCDLREMKEDELSVYQIMGKSALHNEKIFPILELRRFLAPMNEIPMVEAMLNRFPEKDDVKYSSQLLTYIMTLCERPTIMVMWAYWMWHTATHSDAGEVTWRDFVKEFSDHVPTNLGYRTAWLRQKDGNRNLLDDREYWKVKINHG